MAKYVQGFAADYLTYRLANSGLSEFILGPVFNPSIQIYHADLFSVLFLYQRW
jgi:hypothetical protein